jgi:DNA-binding beta-propeller fold protein YncE
MSDTSRMRSAVLAAAMALVAFPALGAAQADMAPTNNLPNPYTTVEGWAQLPDGREWGSTSAVDIDPDGTSIWVAERCSTNQRGCAVNADLDPILKFDSNGNLVTSFGAGLIVWPHGITVDPQGNVWVTDAQDNSALDGVSEADVYGHQVLKFSPDGELLLVLGQRGGVPVEERAAAAAGRTSSGSRTTSSSPRTAMSSWARATAPTRTASSSSTPKATCS